MNKLGSAGAPGGGSFLFADPVSEDKALRAAAHASEERALTALREYQEAITGSTDGEHGEH
jgi:ubiquinol-cytochrome c reductase cytochrome b subunit